MLCTVLPRPISSARIPLMPYKQQELHITVRAAGERKDTGSIQHKEEFTLLSGLQGRGKIQGPYNTKRSSHYCQGCRGEERYRAHTTQRGVHITVRAAGERKDTGPIQHKEDFTLLSGLQGRGKIQGPYNTKRISHYCQGCRGEERYRAHTTQRGVHITVRAAGERKDTGPIQHKEEFTLLSGLQGRGKIQGPYNTKRRLHYNHNS